jgi:hypothetical protein
MYIAVVRLACARKSLGLRLKWLHIIFFLTSGILCNSFILLNPKWESRICSTQVILNSAKKFSNDNNEINNSTLIHQNQKKNQNNIYIGLLADNKLLPIDDYEVIESKYSLFIKGERSNPDNNSDSNINRLLIYITNMMSEFKNESEILWSKENIMKELKNNITDKKIENIKKKFSSSELNILKQKYHKNPNLFKFMNKTFDVNSASRSDINGKSLYMLLDIQYEFLSPIKKGNLTKLLTNLQKSNIVSDEVYNEIKEFVKYSKIFTNYVFICKDKDKKFLYGIVGEVKNKKYIIKGIIRNYLPEAPKARELCSHLKNNLNFLDIKNSFTDYIIKNHKEINEVVYNKLYKSIFIKYIYKINFFTDSNNEI